MTKKKKIKLPRASWHMKPMTRVKTSDKLYNRKKEKSNWRSEE